MAIQPKLSPSTQPAFTLQIDAPAKINHFLHVLGRRNDGYHDLQTGFQFLAWGDVLHWRDADDFQVTGLGLPEQDNLVWQAAQRLAKTAGIKPRGHLYIEKHIPAGAGLGGGSSDAASALLMLRSLWNVDLSDSMLMALGAELGADVPIFIFGRSAIGEGIGERLTPIEWPETSIDLFMPPVHVPTRNIFVDERLTRDSQPINIRAALDGQGHNDCENVCRMQFPEVDQLFALLKDKQPKLSGSGGTVFVINENWTESELAQCQVRHRRTQTTNHSSAIDY